MTTERVPDITWITGLLVVTLFVSAIGMFSVVSKISATGFATASGTTNATVAASTTISLTVNGVNFGTVSLNDVNDTSDADPAPFVLQNDGNSNLNITINATALWAGTGATGNSSYYQFQSNESELGSLVTAATDSVTSWTNIPISSAGVKFVTNFNYTNNNDTVKGHVKITVPADEPAGAKTSTVTFTSSAA